MPGSEFPEETAALLPGLAAASPPRALSQLVALVTGQVAGCSGATAVLLRDGAAPVHGASHPDLSELAEREYEARRGPVFTALNENLPVSCPDLLDEERWPEYASAALARGVRCTLTLVHRSGRPWWPSPCMARGRGCCPPVTCRWPGCWPRSAAR
jgi:hypothetical protein